MRSLSLLLLATSILLVALFCTAPTRPEDPVIRAGVDDERTLHSLQALGDTLEAGKTYSCTVFVVYPGFCDSLYATVTRDGKATPILRQVLQVGDSAVDYVLRVDSAGTYDLKLLVIKNNGARDSLSANVIVRQPIPPVVIDTIPPTITIISPAHATVVGTPGLTVLGRASDSSGIAWVTVNGDTADFGSGDTWSANLTLNAGANTITAIAADSSGNKDTVAISVTFTPAVGDLTPPTLAVDAPHNGDTVGVDSVQVRGTAQDASGIFSLTVAGKAVALDSTSHIWSTYVKLRLGRDTIIVIATDKAPARNVTRDTLRIVYDTVAPAIGRFPVNVTPSDTNLVKKIPYQTDYLKGSAVKLVARPAVGYAFFRWRGDIGAADSTKDTLNLTVDTTKNVTAVFNRITFTIAASVTGGNGTITPSGNTTVNYGVDTTFTIAPNVGYAVQDVKVDNISVGAVESYKFANTTSHHTIAASFALKAFAMTVTTSHGTVTTNPSTSVPLSYGTTVTLRASPDAGYYFSGWSGGVSSIDTPLVVFLTRDTSITANFAQIGRFSVNVTPSDTNLVKKIPYQTDYLKGSAVKLVAKPAAGYTFFRWRGDIGSADSTKDTLNLTVDTTKNVIAVFAIKAFQLSVSAVNGTVAKSVGGTITTSSTFDSNTVVTLSATASPGYRFTSWGGGATGSNLTATVTMNAAQSVTASFVRQYMLTIASLPAPHGTTTPVSSTVVDSGASTSLTISYVDTGWSFVNWTISSSAGALSNATSGVLASVKLTAGNATVTANYSPNSYTISFDPQGGANLTPTSKSVAFASPYGTLATTNRTGYVFDGWWTEAGGTGSQITSARTVSIAAAQTLYAKWTTVSYAITYNLNSGTNSPSNPGIYTIETPTIVLANPSRLGYCFAGWYSNSLLTGTTATSIPVGTTGPKEYWAKWVIRDVDGNTYTEVSIGTQVWMVENLKVTRFNDSSALPLVTDSAAWSILASPGFVWPNNSVANKSFGALYNFYAVNTGKLAPDGWHVPTDGEWLALLNYLNLNGYAYDGTSSTGNYVAKAMAAKSSWASSTSIGAVGNDLTLNNRSGFSALPAGYRYRTSQVGSFGTTAMLWSSTSAGATTIPCYGLENFRSWVFRYNTGGNNDGLSVRLLRNY